MFHAVDNDFCFVTANRLCRVNSVVTQFTPTHDFFVGDVPHNIFFERTAKKLSHGQWPLYRFTSDLVQASPQRGLQQCHRGDDRGTIFLRLEKPARLQVLGQTHLVRHGLQGKGEFENELVVFRQYVRPPDGLDTDARAG